eukprot:15447714-Alexandrium_andersonii.AAC.1
MGAQVVENKHVEQRGQRRIRRGKADSSLWTNGGRGKTDRPMWTNGPLDVENRPSDVETTD